MRKSVSTKGQNADLMTYSQRGGACEMLDDQQQMVSQPLEPSGPAVVSLLEIPWDLKW